MECDIDYVERRESDWETAEDAPSDGYLQCSGHYGQLFYWKGPDEVAWGIKSSTHIRRRWQNILTKLYGVIGRSREASAPFEAWNCLVTDGILDNIVQHTNRYILIIRPNFSRESDGGLVEKNEMKAFIGRLCLAGALRSNKC
jgi:hypothetical protein